MEVINKDIKKEFTKYEAQIIGRIRAFLRAGPNYQSVCVAGGWVRDKIMGEKSKDLDISFPSKDENLFINDLNINFCPPEIVVANDERVSIILQKPPFFIEQEPIRGFKVTIIELADQSRKHKYKLDMRAFKGDSAETDFYSRDFTVNAIYYDIKEDKLIDPGNVK